MSRDAELPGKEQRFFHGID